MPGTFGQRLHRLRLEKGLTQEQVAEATGVSIPAVSKWENDISAPDISSLSSLANVLGVSLDELLGSVDTTPRMETEEQETRGEKKRKKPKLVAHILVQESTGETVRVNIPVGSIDKAAKLFGGLDSDLGDAIDLGQIKEMVENGMRGDIVDIQEPGGDKVKITISASGDGLESDASDLFPHRKKGFWWKRSKEEPTSTETPAEETEEIPSDSSASIPDIDTLISRKKDEIRDLASRMGEPGADLEGLSSRIGTLGEQIEDLIDARVDIVEIEAEIAELEGECQAYIAAIQSGDDPADNARELAKAKAEIARLKEKQSKAISDILGKYPETQK